MTVFATYFYSVLWGLCSKQETTLRVTSKNLLHISQPQFAFYKFSHLDIEATWAIPGATWAVEVFQLLWGTGCAVGLWLGGRWECRCWWSDKERPKVILGKWYQVSSCWYRVLWSEHKTKMGEEERSWGGQDHVGKWMRLSISSSLPCSNLLVRLPWRLRR